MMPAPGFREEYGFNAASGREGFFGKTNTFNAYGARFCRETAAQGDSKFLEPPILARGDHGA
jgi:hypothetical protein